MTNCGQLNLRIVLSHFQIITYMSSCYAQAAVLVRIDRLHVKNWIVERHCVALIR